MFDEKIKTFIQVVKYGSFSKAAEVMYLSPNAIKKRIQALEEQTGIILFTRSNKGVTLTRAGESLYHDFAIMSKQYKKSIEKAYRIQTASSETLCIGMMNTFADTFTTNNWYEVRKKLNNTSVHIMYYGSTSDDMHELFQDIGSKLNMCIEIYDPDVAKKYGLLAQKISEFRMYIGIPDTKEFTADEMISFEDLEGHTLSLLPHGRSTAFDMIREQIESEYLSILLEDINEYSIRTFNDCYEKNNCILVTANQTELYPFYRFYPFIFEMPVEFGIYYSKKDKQRVEEFIEKISY